MGNSETNTPSGYWRKALSTIRAAGAWLTCGLLAFGAVIAVLLVISWIGSLDTCGNYERASNDWAAYVAETCVIGEPCDLPFPSKPAECQ